MKKTCLSFLVLSIVIFASSHSLAGEGSSKLMQIGISDVFIPAGFDSASDVYVVASGVFPNGCYRWSHADVVHKDAYSHEVRSMANVSQGMCIMVLVPFSKEVKLGKFGAGKHTLKFLNGDGTYLEKTLSIE